MERTRERGLTRSIGVSNFSAADLDQVAAAGSVVPAVDQIQFSPVSYRRAQGVLSATVTLPAGLTGAFAWHGLERKLGPGEQSFRLQ